jgi:uncharacterized protein (TIGR02145 family)
MKRSKLFLVLIITIYQIGISTYAQKVSNITFRQEQSTIIVSYDLETNTPCKVGLYVSTNGGVKWQGPLKKVIGDVGINIVSGNNSIAWNVLEEFKELKGNNIKFQIRTSENNNGTVMIGDQEWTTKNLNVTKYRNGDIIPEVSNQKKWDKLTTGAWCYYNNDPKNGAIYGKLYNWYAVNDPRGLAPKGFHIPSDSEWQTLIDYLGGEKIAGGRMKKTGILNWSAPYWAMNENYFSGLPGGYRSHGYLDWDGTVIGQFDGIGSSACWWSSTYESGSYSVLSRSLYKDDNEGSSSKSHMKWGYSVRCVKD